MPANKLRKVRRHAAVLEEVNQRLDAENQMLRAVLNLTSRDYTNSADTIALHISDALGLKPARIAGRDGKLITLFPSSAGALSAKEFVKLLANILTEGFPK